MKKFSETFILNNENIDAVSARITDFLKEEDYSNEVKVSTRISAETILLQWMENSGSGKSFDVVIKKDFGRINILLLLEGEKISVSESADDNKDFLNILENNLTSTVSIKYYAGTNRANIKLPRQVQGGLHKILIAYVLACVLGKFLTLVLPEDVLVSLSNDYLTPAFTTIIMNLGGVAAFQIFLSIINSIVKMGNIAVFKNTGGKYLRLVFTTTIITTIIGGILMLLICPIIKTGAIETTSNINAIYKLIIDIFPRNLIKPFIDDNMLQIIFLGVFFGTILLIYQEKTSCLNDNIDALNSTFMYAIIALSKLMPVFIFLSVLNFFVTNQIKLVLNSWFLIVVHAACCIAVALSMLIMASIYTKTNLLKLIKKCLPVLFVGFSTASTIITVPAIKKVLDSYDVDSNNSKFSINLGYVISRQTSCMVTMSIIVCYYLILGKTMGLGEFVVLSITSIFLAVAAPSVPGSGATIIGGLMVKYGLPVEIVAVVLSLDYVMDMSTTGTGCVCMAAEGLMLNKMTKKV